MILLAPLLLFAQVAAPTQIDRGEALFMDSARGCASCHALKGKGTAVGPDLKGMSRLSPKAISTSLRSTVTQYVQIVKLKSGESFPSMPPADEAKFTLYDLSKTPPARHEVAKTDVASTAANNGWKHPPATRKYTNEELADIVAYIRFAGANNRQAVSPDDVQ
jgi:mono/diheme cytochrome c family protein